MGAERSGVDGGGGGGGIRLCVCAGRQDGGGAAAGAGVGVAIAGLRHGLVLPAPCGIVWGGPTIAESPPRSPPSRVQSSFPAASRTPAGSPAVPAALRSPC